MSQYQLSQMPTPTRSGKVRDIYDLDDKLLIVATNRVSAFDRVLKQTIPGKGRALTHISKFWFEQTSHIVKNHVISYDPDSYPSEFKEFRNALRGVSMLVKKTKVLPCEAIVRGYITGSAWKQYQLSGSVCGILLPEGLQNASKLPDPIFTPSTKSDHHDENIDFNGLVGLIGYDKSSKIMEHSLRLYKFGASIALLKGILLADTKFEFGIDENGEIILIDEVLTPDSSRYWPLKHYVVGSTPPSLDKQYLRDYLVKNHPDFSLGGPVPELPEDVIAKLARLYNSLAIFFGISFE